MNRELWLLLSLGSVAGGLSVACTSEFASCEARRTCPAGGHAGKTQDVGEAGAASGGKAGSGEPSAGAAGSEADDSDDEGSAGEGGAGNLVPVQFGACSVKGALACVGHAGAQRLACDGKVWQAGTTCGANELCDSSDGTCAKTVSECASAKPGAVFCQKDRVVRCGPDLVTATELETCVGVCKSGVCQAPACGDEKLEKGEICDDPVANASGACAKCQHASCGDGVVYVAGKEQCDDGNKVSGDGCSATCLAEPDELALGEAISCARSSTGLVKCWGHNGSGALGLGHRNAVNTVPRELPSIELGTNRTAQHISTRGGSVCALLDNGDVKCWGNNSWGQLGTGHKFNLGDDPGEMGDALLPISLGVGLKAISVSAGTTHTCVVLGGGGVKCWGSAAYGQLGQDSLAEALSPSDMLIGLKGAATAVSASNYLLVGKGGYYGASTCALLVTGAVQCWGYAPGVPYIDSMDLNGSSSIGDAPGEMSTVPALTFSAGKAAKSVFAGGVSAAVLEDGSLRLWGHGPQLGRQPDSNTIGMTPMELTGLSAVDTGGKKVNSIAVGRDHACAVLEGGLLKCWGSNYSGQLGSGSTEPTPSETGPGPLNPVDLGGHTALQVAAGQFHTCAILDNRSVRCWGDNSQGQLGLVHTDGLLSADTTVDLAF